VCRALVVLAALLAAAGVPRAQDAGGEAARGDAAYEHAARTILCDCGCHPQSVRDCACGRADAMRREMQALAAAGKTGGEIVAVYVAQHGDKILVAPPASGFNLVAWLGPLVVFVVGGSAVALVVARWTRRRAQDEPPAPAPPSSATSDEYRERLRQALRSME
jgi:cytochrome c-type biogenesis protein CcmH/NrfF